MPMKERETRDDARRHVVLFDLFQRKDEDDTIN